MYEIKKLNNIGYNRVIEYESWTVANLRACPDTKLEAITSFQKHFETDEVFILLSGKACLIVLEGEIFDSNKLTFINLEPNKAYNIKKGVYHQHVLSDDANLCIVENQNTDDDLNSKRIYLSDEEILEFRSKAKENVYV